MCVTVLAACEEMVPFVGLEPQAVSQRWGRDAGFAYAAFFYIFGRPSADVCEYCYAHVADVTS